jgi:hypothetical protein
MKEIVIVTHDDDEIKQMNNVDNVLPFEITDNNRKISVFKKVASSNENNLFDILCASNENKILLYHLGSQIFNKWENFNKFDVGTKGNKIPSPDRAQYKKLLDANFEGEINNTDKEKAFDDVWDYFANHHGVTQFNDLKFFFTSLKLEDIGNDEKVAEIQKQITDLRLNKLQ